MTESTITTKKELALTKTGMSLGFPVHTAITAIGLIVIILSGQTCLHAALTQHEHAVEQAKQYLNKGEFEKAYQEFYELFKDDPANPDINFMLGLAAFGNKDYEAAVMAFERVLIARPDAIRVKLEIARSLYNLGSTETARQYFHEVLESNPPEKVKKNIELYLNSIDRSVKEHFLSGRMSLGVDWDDNANVAPASSQIEITTALGDLIPISVDRAARDQIRSSTCNLNYLYRPSGASASWNISILNYNAAYRFSEDLDINLLDVKAGISLQGRVVSWDLYGIANHLNLDYTLYQRSYGAGTSLSLVLRPEILLRADARYRKKNYDDTFDRDAVTTTVSLGPVFAFGANRINTSVGVEYENAIDDMNSYRRLNAVASWDLRLPYGFTFFANYWYQGSNYREPNILFNKKRRDDVQYYTLGMAKTIWQSGSTNTMLLVNAGYSYTRSHSNIDLYTYTKNVNSCSVSFVF